MKKITSIIASLWLATIPQETAPQEPYKVFNSGTGKPISVHYNVGNQLLFLYGNIDRELPMCLMGTEDDESYKIERLAFPVYASSSPLAAGFVTQPCLDEETEDLEYLGVVHNHGVGSCQPSILDFERFLGDGDSDLEMVVCKADLVTGELGLSIHSKEHISSNQ